MQQNFLSDVIPQYKPTLSLKEDHLFPSPIYYALYTFEILLDFVSSSAANRDFSFFPFHSSKKITNSKIDRKVSFLKVAPGNGGKI